MSPNACGRGMVCGAPLLAPPRVLIAAFRTAAAHDGGTGLRDGDGSGPSPPPPGARRELGAARRAARGAVRALPPRCRRAEVPCGRLRAAGGGGGGERDRRPRAALRRLLRSLTFPSSPGGTGEGSGAGGRRRTGPGGRGRSELRVPPQPRAGRGGRRGRGQGGRPGAVTS